MVTTLNTNIHTDNRQAESDFASAAAFVRNHRSPEPTTRVGNRLEQALARIAEEPEPPEPTAEESRAAEKREEERQHAAEKQRRVAAFRKLQLARGRRYRDCQFSNFQVDNIQRQDVLAQVQEFATSMPERISRGGGLIMFGPAGTGKDHLLMATMRAATLSHGLTVDWYDGFDLYAAIKRNIKSDSVDRFITGLKRPDVLAISDPVVDRTVLSEFELRCLRRIIEMRYSARKSTWITANVGSASYGVEQFTAPLFGRLLDDSTVIKFDLPNYRKPRITSAG